MILLITGAVDRPVIPFELTILKACGYGSLTTLVSFPKLYLPKNSLVPTDTLSVEETLTVTLLTAVDPTPTLGTNLSMVSTATAS